MNRCKIEVTENVTNTVQRRCTQRWTCFANQQSSTNIMRLQNVSKSKISKYKTDICGGLCAEILNQTWLLTWCRNQFPNECCISCFNLNFRPRDADDTEEDPSDKTFEANGGAGKLRSCAQRVFLRQAPRSICTNTQLLQVLFFHAYYYLARNEGWVHVNEGYLLVTCNRCALMYRADGVDGPQEMEIN